MNIKTWQLMTAACLIFAFSCMGCNFSGPPHSGSGASGYEPETGASPVAEVTPGNPPERVKPSGGLRIAASPEVPIEAPSETQAVQPTPATRPADGVQTAASVRASPTPIAVKVVRAQKGPKGEWVIPNYEERAAPAKSTAPTPCQRSEQTIVDALYFKTTLSSQESESLQNSVVAEIESRCRCATVVIHWIQGNRASADPHGDRALCHASYDCGAKQNLDWTGSVPLSATRQRRVEP